MIPSDDNFPCNASLSGQGYNAEAPCQCHNPIDLLRLQMCFRFALLEVWSETNDAPY